MGVWGQLSAVALDIIAPFRRPVFRWLFIYYIMYGVSFQITNTYTQYYLADVIGPDFSLQLPGGKRLSVVDNAESAISFMNIMCARPPRYSRQLELGAHRRAAIASATTS